MVNCFCMFEKCEFRRGKGDRGGGDYVGTRGRGTCDNLVGGRGGGEQNIMGKTIVPVYEDYFK